MRCSHNPYRYAVLGLQRGSCGHCRYFPPTVYYHNGSEKNTEKRKKTHLFGFMKINVKKKLEIARNGRLFTPKVVGN
jgi:hypothetical protein